MLIFTLAAMGLGISRVAGGTLEFNVLLLAVAGFALFFFTAGLFLARRLANGSSSQSRFAKLFGDPASQIPAFSALLLFILLIMMSQRLPMAGPDSLFGLGLLCVVLGLGLSRILTIEWLPLCGLIGIAGLEYAWHDRSFYPEVSMLPLYWNVGFYAIFSIYPACLWKSVPLPRKFRFTSSMRTTHR